MLVALDLPTPGSASRSAEDAVLMSTRAEDAGAVEDGEVIGGRAGCVDLGCGICARAGVTIMAARAAVIANGRIFIGILYGT